MCRSDSCAQAFDLSTYRNDVIPAKWHLHPGNIFVTFIQNNIGAVWTAPTLPRSESHFSPKSFCLSIHAQKLQTIAIGCLYFVTVVEETIFARQRCFSFLVIAHKNAKNWELSVRDKRILLALECTSSQQQRYESPFGMLCYSRKVKLVTRINGASHCLRLTKQKVGRTCPAVQKWLKVRNAMYGNAGS